MAIKQLLSSKLSSAAAIGTVALTATVAMPAFAEEPFYVSLGAGVNILSDIDLNSSDFIVQANTRTLDFDVGVAVAAAIGYRFHPFFRGEAELSYRRNTYDGATVENEGPVSASGDVTAFGFMLNGWVDLPNSSMITPYVGGGIGAAHVVIDASTGRATPADGAYNFDDSDTVFAYQIGTGVAVTLPNGMELTLDYRYFHADGMDVAFTGDETGTAQSSDYKAHSAMVGVRIPFGMPGH